MVALCVLFMSGCSEDSVPAPDTDNSGNDIPMAVTESFVQDFPDAEAISWQQTDCYAAVMFRYVSGNFGLTAGRAWYALDSGILRMQVFDREVETVPQAVMEAFMSGYAGWTLNRAREMCRFTQGIPERFYVLCVTGQYENGIYMEGHLFYTEDGFQVDARLKEKEKGDTVTEPDYPDWLPTPDYPYIIEFISTLYPEARCMAVYSENNVIKAKILDGILPRLLVFGRDGEWRSTRTALDVEELPVEVRAILSSSEHASSEIIKAEEYITAAEGVYYILTLKNQKGKKEEFRIDPDGNGDSDSGNSGEDTGNTGDITTEDVIAKTDIDTYIQSRYPGAVISKKDYDDDGLEVKLSVDGIEVEMTFASCGGKGYAWLRSESDLRVSDAPAAVQATVMSRYAEYEFYFLTYIETASEGSWYEVGLKSRTLRRSLKVRMDIDGNVLAEYDRH